MEEFILYIDQEVRFPLRVKYNRLMNKINRFINNHPELWNLLTNLLVIYIYYLYIRFAISTISRHTKK